MTNPSAPPGAPPARAVVLPCAAIVLIHVLQRPSFDSAWSLDEEAYFRPHILTAWLHSPWSLVAWLGPALIIGWQSWRSAGLRWFERVPVYTAAGLLIWQSAGYPYNHFYDQAHDLDRALIVVLGLLGLWRPVFLAPFLALATMTLHQFDWPTEQHSFTDKQPLLNILSFTLGYLYLRRFRPGTPSHCLLFVILVSMASNYFVPAWKKLEINWLAHNDLLNLSLAAIDIGWLNWLEPATRERVLDFVQTANVPLMVGTLVLEVGALFILWRRPVTVALLVGLAGMHLGIFAFSGILFWKWVTLDLALIVAICGLPRAELPLLYRPALFSMFFLLVLAAEPIFHPLRLGWFDSPVSTVFRFEGVAEDGRRYEVAPYQFAPYDFPIVQGRYHYLNDVPMVVNTLGSVRKLRFLKALEEADDVESLRRVQDEMGKPKHDISKSAQMERFLLRVIDGMNGRDGGVRRDTPFGAFPPPQHQWGLHATDLPRYTGEQRLTGMVVRRVSSKLSRESRLVFREQVVLEVDLDDPVAKGRSGTAREPP